MNSNTNNIQMAMSHNTIYCKNQFFGLFCFSIEIYIFNIDQLFFLSTT